MKNGFLMSFLLVSILCVCCKGKPQNTNNQKETTDTTAVTDSSVVTQQEPYDWTPDGFKEDHYEEWLVVKPSIDLQQSGEDIDFSKIDTLVREYIHKQGIRLPSDVYSQIKKIDQICDSKFDIDGYDGSNFGMHIADGTSRLFDMYINWLMEEEAKKVCTEINLAKEKEMLKPVMDAYYACCDSIGFDFDGSGGWHGEADFHRIELNYMKSMYAMFLTKSTHTTLPLLLTPEHFKSECDIRFANYKQDYEEFASPQSVKKMLDNYYLSVKNWLEYRSKVESAITTPALRREYSYNTRLFARELYIHLKNEFGDLGLMSTNMYNKCFLHLDCTDEEMLKYSYEEAFNNYVNN